MENPLGVRSENSLTQKCGGIVNSSRTKVVAINMNHVSIYKDILGTLRRNEKKSYFFQLNPEYELNLLRSFPVPIMVSKRSLHLKCIPPVLCPLSSYSRGCSRSFLSPVNMFLHILHLRSIESRQ